MDELLLSYVSSHRQGGSRGFIYPSIVKLPFTSIHYTVSHTVVFFLRSPGVGNAIKSNTFHGAVAKFKWRFVIGLRI